MITLSPLSDPKYLTSSARCTKESRNTPKSSGDYYANDPFKKPAMWIGNVAHELGLIEKRSVVDLEDFDDAYFGFIPRSLNPNGSLDPFIDGTPSKEDQIRNSEAKKKLKEEISKLEVELKNLKILNPTEDLKNSKVQAEIEAREKEIRSLNGEAAGRRPGSDITFSAPKTVSMLHAHAICFGKLDLVKKIEAAQAKAVKDTMALIEKEFILTRRRAGVDLQREGKVVHENTVLYENIEGILAAMFHHFEAREVDGSGPDPQLHTHVAVMNAVQGVDGDFQMAFMDHLKENIHAMGAAYRSVLAHELRMAGIKLIQPEGKNQKIVNFEVAGLEDHIDAFSRRSKEIEKALKNGTIQSKSHGAVLTRSAKKEKTGDELLEIWTLAFEKAKLRLFNFHKPLELQERAAKEKSKKEKKTYVKKVIPPYVPRTNDEVKEILFNMETHFSTVDLRKILFEEAQFLELDTLQTMTSFQWVDRRMDELLKDPDLIAVHDPSKSLKDRARGFDRFGNAYYASKKIIAQEQDFYSNVIPKLVEPNQEVKFSENEINKKIAAIEAKLSTGGKVFKLQDFQKEAVKKALLNPSQLSIQIAGAGFGKTTAAIFTKAILESVGCNVIGCAPSNAAAQQLATDLNKDLGTRAPLVEAKSVDKLLKELSGEKPTLTLNEKSVVMVDEAGMVSFKNYYALMQHVQKANARIILMGDHKQLNSVGMGDVLRRLKQRSDVQAHSTFEIGGAFEDYRFISRQKTEWMKQAAQYAALGCAQECWDMYEKEGLVTLKDDEGELEKELCSDYISSSKPVQQKMILASTNEACQRLNEAVRKSLKENGFLTGATFTNKNGLELCEKDYLLARDSLKVTAQDSNQKSIEVKLAKNSKLTVVGIDKGQLQTKVTFETDVDGKKVTFTLDDQNSHDAKKLKQLGYAYAVTVHKSQGATVDEVFYMPSKFVSQELFYVATSRHRENLKMYALKDAKAQILANASSIQEKQHVHDLQRVASCVAPVDDLEKACLIQDEQAYKAPTSFALDSIPEALDYVTFDDRHVYIRNSGGLIEEHAFEKTDDPVLQKLLSKCSGVCPSLQDLKREDEERKQRMAELCDRQTIGTEVEVRNGTVRLRFTERMDSQAFEERIDVLSSHARWDPDPNQMDQGWWVFKSFQSGEKYLNSHAHPEPNLPAWNLLQEAALDVGSPTSAPSSAPLPDTSPANLSAPSSASELVDPSASVSADQSATSSAELSASPSASFAVQSQGVVPRENSDLLQPLKETDFFAGKGHFSLGFSDGKISPKSNLKTTWSLDQDAYQAIRSSGVKVKLSVSGKKNTKLQLIEHEDQTVTINTADLQPQQLELLRAGKTCILALDENKKPFKFEVQKSVESPLEKVAAGAIHLTKAVASRFVDFFAEKPLTVMDAKPITEPMKGFSSQLFNESKKQLIEGRWINMATTIKHCMDPFFNEGILGHFGKFKDHHLAAIYDRSTQKLHQVPLSDETVMRDLAECKGWPITLKKDANDQGCGLDLPEMKTNWADLSPEQRTMEYTIGQFRDGKTHEFEILRFSNEKIYFGSIEKKNQLPKLLILDRSTPHPTLEKLGKLKNSTLQHFVGTRCKLAFENGSIKHWLIKDANVNNHWLDLDDQQDFHDWRLNNDEAYRTNFEWQIYLQEKEAQRQAQEASCHLDENESSDDLHASQSLKNEEPVMPSKNRNWGPSM